MPASPAPSRLPRLPSASASPPRHLPPLGGETRVACPRSGLPAAFPVPRLAGSRPAGERRCVPGGAGTNSPAPAPGSLPAALGIPRPPRHPPRRSPSPRFLQWRVSYPSRRPAPCPHLGSRRFVVPGCRCCRRAGAGPVLPLGTPRPFPQRGWNLINSRAMKLNGGGLRDRRFGSRRGETRPRAGGLPALPPGAPGVGRHCRGTARAFGCHC